MKKYYLLNFKTPTFEFKLLSNTPEEIEMIEELGNDELTKQYLPEFKQYVEETKSDIEKGLEPLRYTTIVYKDGKAIGILSLFDLDDNLIMSHGIAPKYRGNRYSSQIKSEVFEYVFSVDPSIEKITAYVETTNSNNLKSIARLAEQNIKEVYDKSTGKKYFEVTTYNPYYTKNQTNQL